MIFWIILAVVFIALAITLLAIERKHYKWDCTWRMFVGWIASTMAFFLVLIPIMSRLDYNKFERAFEIQREMYSQLDIDEESNVMIIIDILEANQTLAECKASKELYGFASVIPDRVFDIDPIGVE